MTPAMVQFARNVQEKQRLKLISMESDHVVTAHYNPKEVQIEKAQKWEVVPVMGGLNTYLNFAGSDGRTISMELLLDCFEEKGPNLEAVLDTLHELGLPIDEEGEPWQRRPPILEVGNGPVPGYRCVLESAAVKVLMTDAFGNALRATVNVKLKEARIGRDGYLLAASGGAQTLSRDKDGGIKYSTRKANGDEVAHSQKAGHKTSKKQEPARR